MMKLIQFALWQLMIMAVTIMVGGLSNYETLNLQVHIGGVSKTLQLTRVDRVLANKFLPVWITLHKTGTSFVKTNIMDKLGDFTMFHDYCTKSAFVYFHDRRELDGVIDVTYYVKRYPIIQTKEVHVIGSKYLHRVKQDDLSFSRLIRSIDNTTTHRARRTPKLKVYPEVLVAISHDTYMAINQDTKLSRGIATVSHVLTVYNAADMLYKLMTTNDIQLNIAGIVIEHKTNQWGFESKQVDSEPYIDVNTIHTEISKFFWKYENHFPRHSYDIIVYHTRNVLVDHEGEEYLGFAIMTTGDPMFRPFAQKNRFNAVVQDFTTYEHFTTIAHEIAHLFGAKHDGEGDLGGFFDMDTCGKSLMAEAAHCTESCLNWSKQTEAEVAAFLRMPVYCNLKNYPRSLDIPRPKLIFSVEEQCECIGCKSSLGLTQYISPSDCEWPLPCVSDSNRQVPMVPLPMDGTPCGLKKVCWAFQCVEYEIEM